CAIIFSNNNEIISWGPINDEFKHFNHLDLIHIGKIVDTNLQSLFSDQDNNHNTHPEMERRDDLQIYDTHDDDEVIDDDYDDGYPVQNNSSQPISLQEAIATTFGKFIDKSLTVNYWQCGLDLNLNTWKNKLFSRREYNQQIEQQQRTAMKQYAINDCTAVAELFFYMYPSKANDYQTQETPPSPPPPPTTTNTTTTTITTTNIITNYENELSDISEDELIEMLKPKFNKKQKLIEFNPPDEQAIEEPFEQPSEQQHTQIQSISKSERQKRKNEKLKWKQQNRPDFKNKLKRPIYYKYEFRKIRAQLRDDNIHTSHQITINRKYNEVIIGFKSQQALEHATKIIKINYFSKNQYIERWGLIQQQIISNKITFEQLLAQVYSYYNEQIKAKFVEFHFAVSLSPFPDPVTESQKLIKAFIGMFFLDIVAERSIVVETNMSCLQSILQSLLAFLESLVQRTPTKTDN
ncbi:unnamed protein product, partial [Rotaria sordida]